MVWCEAGCHEIIAYFGWYSNKCFYICVCFYFSWSCTRHSSVCFWQFCLTSPPSLLTQMNSLGSSSKWPSYDSLPSASSFLLSESDQTEDEADVFSEGEGYGGRANSLSADKEITISGNYLDFPGQPREPRARSKCEPKHPNSASFPGAATLGASSASPGDLAFAQKVSAFTN